MAESCTNSTPKLMLRLDHDRYKAIFIISTAKFWRYFLIILDLWGEGCHLGGYSFLPDCGDESSPLVAESHLSISALGLVAVMGGSF